MAAAVDSTPQGGLSGLQPFTKAFAVSKSDSLDLPFVTRGLYTGAGGIIQCTLSGDSSPVTYAAVPAGVILDLRITRVWSTTTTATGMVGLY